ncbi:MAG: dockerin type I repeat-containing protein [Clostridia bacterium]|nr:dockerin type I repeat-containing protein [Clostridia bacterium]
MSHAKRVTGRAAQGILSVLLTVVLFVSCICCAPSASAYSDAEMFMSTITSDYSSALARAGRSSFHGYCNLATAYQLLVKGVYSGGLDYSGGGDTWYSYYSGITARNPSYRTSGGYYVVTYGGSDCLASLIADYGSDIRNVAYCLGTGGTSGTTHVMLISGLINGYVYFADSFGYYYNGYKSEGTAMRMPLSEFISAYVKMNGYPHGCVYFTRDKTKTPGRTSTFTETLTSSSTSSGNPETSDNDTELELWEDPNLEVYEEELYKYYEPGIYLTVSGANIFSNAGDYILTDTVRSGEAVSITQIVGSRGKLENGGYIDLDKVTVYPAPTIVSVRSEKEFYSGTDSTMKWTVDAEGGIGDLTFSYTVYNAAGKNMASDKNSNGTFAYKPTKAGEYTLWVTVTDSNGVSSARVSEPVSFTKSNSAGITGDVDGDGIVTASDSRTILRVSASLESFKTKAAKTLADIDKDDKITAADARYALRLSANLAI